MDKLFALLAVSAVCSPLIIANDSDKPEAAIVDRSPKLPKPPSDNTAQALSSDSRESTTGENSSTSAVSKVPLTDPLMAFPPPTSEDWNEQ